MGIFDRKTPEVAVIAPVVELPVAKAAVGGLKADINPGKKASVSRRVNRHASCLAGMSKAKKRGDTRKFKQLDRERMALEGSLLQERAEIEALLAQSNEAGL